MFESEKRAKNYYNHIKYHDVNNVNNYFNNILFSI